MSELSSFNLAFIRNVVLSHPDMALYSRHVSVSLHSAPRILGISPYMLWTFSCAVQLLGPLGAQTHDVLGIVLFAS